MATRRKKTDLEENITPNLIPMIDIMFLLLLFFILGADMGQRELEDVYLPDADAIAEDKPEEAAGRIMVNVYHVSERDIACALFEEGEVCRDPLHWAIAIMGKDYQPRDLLEHLKVLADQDRDPMDPTKSNVKLMIRGDRSAPYGLVQTAIEACALAGIYKIEVGAARPPA